MKPAVQCGTGDHKAGYIATAVSALKDRYVVLGAHTMGSDLVRQDREAISEKQILSWI